MPAGNGVNGTRTQSEFVKPSTRLRQLLAEPGCIPAPGVYDGISARLAIEAGFPCMYQSGAATTASRLGLPDIAFAGLTDFVANGQMIANIDPRVPLIADADTGFGGPNAVARTVRAYDQAGIAALHLEDQIQTKRCGHLIGKKLVDMDVWTSRIRAAVLGRESVLGGSDLIIIARTDALQSFGLDESIKRLVAARDAGADVGFLEGIETEEQIRETVKAIAPMHLLVNLIPNGTTPHFSLQEVADMGVKVAIYPFVTCIPALHAIRRSLAVLKKTGKDDVQSQGMQPRQFFEVMGLSSEMEVDRAAGGNAFAVDA
ncbi:oxaloacetate acetylhydrolase [Naematelia encephala]|uniref:Oxaloacetate acetylhydrolase n=1 Tax=Naematelia encephala TaxID=71784 RepID=A0A1Y2B277_9TREE|nr:oxaloacetate acetylhydrolase [Naematelia encephala]